MSAGFLAQLSQMAAMSKQATVTTAGIVGDDLAINSQQLIGGKPDRKLPMVYAVAKGSFRNKFFYLIPAALALSVTLPGLIMPALTIGGAYLCFEGIEKFFEKKPQPAAGDKKETAVRDHAAWEKRHVKKAIKTDLILSAEITAVSLWTVAAAPILVQVAAMAAAGIAMTVGVYGIVGGIIKLDDVGAALAKKEGKGLFAKAQRGLGRVLKHTAPGIIKTVGVIGTVAMFLVGGGMVLHGIPGADAVMTTALNAITTNSLLQTALTGAAETAAGVLAGFVALPVMKVIEPPLEKTFAHLKKLVSGVLPKKPAAPETEDDEEAPAPAPMPVAAAPVSPAPPTPKAALNAAAPKTISAENDNQSAPPAVRTAVIAPKTPG